MAYLPSGLSPLVFRLASCRGFPSFFLCSWATLRYDVAVFLPLLPSASAGFSLLLPRWLVL